MQYCHGFDFTAVFVDIPEKGRTFVLPLACFAPAWYRLPVFEVIGAVSLCDYEGLAAVIANPVHVTILSQSFFYILQSRIKERKWKSKEF